MTKYKIAAAICIIICIFLALSLLNCTEQQPPAREPDRHNIDPSDFDPEDPQPQIPAPDSVRYKYTEPT